MSKNIKKVCYILTGIIVAILINTSKTYAITPISEPRYQGIDVSNWQGYIDYQQVANAGIEVVYIKASQGTTYKDPFFEINYENAKANGLKVGFYHYLTATTTQGAEAEARFFASVIAGKTPDCKLVMDYETFRGVGREGINEIARVFLETLQNITNKPVIVYSDLSNAQSTFNRNIADNYQLWLAYYGNYNSLTNVETSWSNWIGIQYSDMGEISGIRGYVDRNLFTQDIFIGEISEIPNTNNDNVLPPTNTQTITYTVQSGNTLSEIAQRYGTTVQEIASINGISNPNLIFPGQIFRIPTNTNVPGQQTGDTGCIIYTIKSGDTLSEIAQRYGTTVQEIVTANKITNANLIFPKEKIRVCNATIIPEETNDNNEKVYIVKSGDTLFAISRMFGVTVDELVRKNGIENRNLIFPGQRIII